MKELENYNRELTEKVREAFEIATAARKKGSDPEPAPEIYYAEDVAARVEGLVGPPGIAEKIRELKKEFSDEGEIALKIAEAIMGGLGGRAGVDAIELAIRSSLAFLTQGVLVAPTEGIAKVEIQKNPDGTRYIAVYYAGPIRSAGGTAQAMSVVVADYVRRLAGLDKFKPYDEELGRYVEEVQMYDRFVRLQYAPTPDEVRHIVTSCPICITGEPTEQLEVSSYRNLIRVETNRLRGGASLVIGEGLALKAPKLLKKLKKLEKYGFADWSWLEKLVKKPKSAADEDGKIPKYLHEVPAGRPVFSEPNAPGGFRLRYGRARTTGFAATAIHPAAMHLVDGYIAIGTQVRLELPGKATVITPCDTIEAPIVRLKSGEVLQIDTIEKANIYKKEVEQILFLGDILVAFGDFLQNNYPLQPSGYVEEWWAQECAGIKELEPYLTPPYKTPPAELAISSARKHNIPLHPKHTFCWNDLTLEELKTLCKQKEFEKLPAELKPILETLGVFHKVESGCLVPSPEHSVILSELLKSEEFGESKTALEAINKISGIKIKDKAPRRVGGRMGRPEKAALRMMKPAPQVLFPTGARKNRIRDLIKMSNEGIECAPELSARACQACGKTPYRICPKCGSETKQLKACPRCGRQTDAGFCGTCKTPTANYQKQPIDLKKLLEQAKERIGENIPTELKGVMGMTSEDKVPEPLEKGLLRAKHGLYVFKDGTIRFDSTDIPLTHFKPKEIFTPAKKLRVLGYESDIYGKPLEREDQILELKPQDILLSDYGELGGAEVFLRTAGFVDDLLEKYYGLPRFYKVRKKEDLIGHLAIGLAPHISAAVVGRIIGFSKARAGYAHPYFHAAKRRNADGDEDAVMLLMDALLNFSRKFLPETRGGTMDAPLVLTPTINQYEIDTEPYDMEIVSQYPLEFYEATLQQAHPSKIADKIKRAGQVLEGGDWLFTHDTSDINMGIKKNRYTEGQMLEKLDEQLGVAKKLRAVDENHVAALVLKSHFLPDIKGNLRTFSNQKFRCTKCNAKYRRVPLSGKCGFCGGNLILTVHKGTVEKYLEASKALIEKYAIPKYLQQHLLILEMQLETVFGKEPHKQVKLTMFN